MGLSARIVHKRFSHPRSQELLEWLRLPYSATSIPLLLRCLNLRRFCVRRDGKRISQQPVCPRSAYWTRTAISSVIFARRERPGGLRAGLAIIPSWIPSSLRTERSALSDASSGHRSLFLSRKSYSQAAASFSSASLLPG